MVNILKKNKELLILIGIVLAIAICVELPSWIQGEYYVSGGDIKTQWYPFYVLNRRETIRSIKAGGLPFYSWVLFLGNNIWSSMVTYGFVDVFNLLFYPFNINYFLIYDIQFVIKLLVAGISFFYLIKYVFNNNKAALFSGVLYASSSFLLHFSSQSGFLSFAALMPLYLIGIVKHIKENKKIVFVISVALLFITNYYLFFSVTVLSPFIYLYCYYNINKSLKGAIVSMLKIMLLYVVGFMISAIFTIPSILYLMQNERLGDFEGNLLTYSNIKTYLHILNSLFVPNELFIYGNNVFFFSEHTTKELCLFSSSLITLLISQVIVSTNKYFKKSTILIFILFAVILFTPFLGSLLNGFSEFCFRWTHLLIMFNIYVSAYILFVSKEISKKTIYIAAIVCIAIILITYFAGLFVTDSIMNDYNKQFVLLLTVVMFLIAYSIFINNRKILLCILVIEIGLYSVLFGYKCVPGVSQSDIDGVTSVLSDVNSEPVKDYLNSLEDSNYQEFYRTYVDYDELYWAFSRNMNLIYNLESVMSYDSTYEPSFSDMTYIKEDGIIKTIYWEYSLDDPDLLNFVSCKYALTLSEDRIPFTNYEIVDDNFRGGILVSKNLDYRPIGETYNIRKDDANRDFGLLSDYIISEDKEIDKYLLSSTRNQLYNVYYYNNQLEAEIESDDISFVVLKLSYDDGYSIYVNNKKVPIYKCNGGMIGFPIEKGKNIINLSFSPKGFKGGFIISSLGLIVFIYLIFEKKIISLIHKQHI